MDHSDLDPISSLFACADPTLLERIGISKYSISVQRELIFLPIPKCSYLEMSRSVNPSPDKDGASVEVWLALRACRCVNVRTTVIALNLISNVHLSPSKWAK